VLGFWVSEVGHLQVNTLESSFGNEYLNSSLFPTLPSAADFPMPLVDEEPDALSRLPSHNSQPELSAGLIRRGTSPMLGPKRNPPPGAGPPMPLLRQSSLGVPPARKRQSLIGAASSHGRLFKLLGDFFILAGRTEDASVWCVYSRRSMHMQHLINIARYTEAIALFKTANDPIWYASALEGLATIALLEAWSGQGTVRSTVHLCSVLEVLTDEHTAYVRQRRQGTLG
jgi:hypothetical protein